MGPNPQFSVDLVTFTEEIPNGKLHFLCSVNIKLWLDEIYQDSLKRQEYAEKRQKEKEKYIITSSFTFIRKKLVYFFFTSNWFINN